MKKIYIVLLTAVLGACAGELDLKPQQSLAEEVAMNSDANIKKALLGAYDGLSGYNANLAAPSFGSLWGGDLALYSELLAADGEISWVGTFNEPREVFGKRMLTNNTYIRNNWTGGYYTINICNNIIASIDKVLAADRNRVRGEALFIRGAVYFDLVRFFAQPYVAGNVAANLGVPIVLEPTKTVTADIQKGRSTVAEVYTQIIADLTEAESLLPGANGVFASKPVAAAVLSRVYLGMEDYAKARDAANRVIQSGEYELTETFAEAFNNAENSSEDIFAMQTNAQDGNNNMQLYWSIPDFGGRDGDVEVNNKHLSMYEEGDDRLELFYEGNGAIRSGKWRDQFTVLPVIRLAEMYLTRAEANFRLGTSVGATPVADVNAIRFRAGLDRFDLDGDEDDPTVPEEEQTPRVYVPLVTVTLNQILKERKLELAHEGSAIHDLKRLKGSADGFAYNANAMVFPIPIREINSNDNLEQNPGYGE